MVKITKLLIASIIGVALATVSSSAYSKNSLNVAKGQKAFQKKLSVKCAMDSEDFAGYHTQEEWIKINLNGNFVAEVEDICEKPVSLTDKEAENVFKYVHTWAADSGLITAEQG